MQTESSKNQPKSKSLTAKLGITSKRDKKGPGSMGDTVQRIQLLLKEAPDIPLAIGKKINANEKKKFFKKNKYPDLNRLRVDLNTLTDSGKIDTHSRQKVRSDIKKYPNVPDLHIINAIYTFQDIPRINDKEHFSHIMQNRVNQSQLLQLQKAIEEMVRAFYQGGISVFNINWFMKIYVEYLTVYKGRLTYEYNGIAKRQNSELTTLANKIRLKQMEILELLNIKDKLGAITKLSRRLNGTTYLSDSFMPMEIKKATQAVHKGELSKIINEDRMSGKIIYVLMTLLFLMAKIPLLQPVLESLLDVIPDDCRSILLRKKMVYTIVKMTQYELAIASGDKNKARSTANQLYKYCLETIHQHLKGTIINEQCEVDPYLKIIWLVKTADGLFERSNYRKLVKEAIEYIKLITGETNQLKESSRDIVVDLAVRYSYQLDNIMEEYGWAGEIESQSWQNRES